MRLGAGTVVLVATDEIFSNKSLTEPDRALLAYRIIEQAPPVGSTWVDESLNSSGVPKVLGILFDPAFRPVTLQLILIVVLFGWSGSRRFGPVEPPTAPRRRSIVEHAEALGILYYRAGAGAHAVRAQLDFLKHELRRLFATAFRAENVDALARRAGLEEREVRTLLRDAEVEPNTRIPNAEASRLLQRLADLSARVRVNSSRTPARRVPPAGKTVPPVPKQPN